jgi:hypothetical protein
LFYRIAGFAGLTGFYFVLPVNPVILLILSIKEPSYNNGIYRIINCFENEQKNIQFNQWQNQKD